MNIFPTSCPKPVDTWHADYFSAHCTAAHSCVEHVPRHSLASGWIHGFITAVTLDNAGADTPFSLNASINHIRRRSLHDGSIKSYTAGESVSVLQFAVLFLHFHTCLFSGTVNCSACTDLSAPSEPTHVTPGDRPPVHPPLPCQRPSSLSQSAVSTLMPA